MSPAPGASVTIIDAPPPPAPASDTGTAFIVGFSDRGPTTGGLKTTDVLTSEGDFIGRYGARQSYSGVEYDAMAAFFAEGGSRLYFSRKVGPAAVIAQASVPTATPKFTAKAKGPGASYNTVSVGVASGVVTVYDGGVAKEVSPAFTDVTQAQLWAQSSSNLLSDITPVGTGALTDSAPVALAGGADDRVNTADVQIQAALDRFGSNLGPGQVALPGDGRQAAYTMAATHARDKNRFAVLDAPDTPTYTNVTAVAATTRSLGRDLARHVVLLDPWLTRTDTNLSRAIPPSGVWMGLAAVNDAAGNPNRAVAGQRSISAYASGVKYVRAQSERDALADAGVTVFRQFGSSVMPYDDVTPVDGTVEPEWLGAGTNRLVMRIVADALSIANAHLFESIANSDVLAGFNGDLKSMLRGWWSVGALYGDAPEDAYRVETGSTVNTPATLAAKQLKAALSLKIAPNARFVQVTITNQGLQEVL
jgi:hypothetical protein